MVAGNQEQTRDGMTMQKRAIVETSPFFSSLLDPTPTFLFFFFFWGGGGGVEDLNFDPSRFFCKLIDQLNLL